MRALLIAFVALTSLSACDSFEPATLVNTLRVLAIRADPAEVGSGETANLRSLVVDFDPNENGRTVSYEWALCTLMPAPTDEINPDCYDADTADFLIPLPSPSDGTTTLVMPQHKISDFGLPDTTGGFYVPIRMRVTAGDAKITAFHRLRWKAGLVPPNNNPTLVDIDYVPTDTAGDLPDMGPTVEPQPLPIDTQPPLEAPLGGKVRLRAVDTPDSTESYITFVGSPGDIQSSIVSEDVQFFWYATAGKIETDVTGEAQPDTLLDTTQYTDALKSHSDVVDLWLVARDERGGIDYLHRQIQLH